MKVKPGNALKQEQMSKEGVWISIEGFCGLSLRPAVMQSEGLMSESPKSESPKSVGLKSVVVKSHSHISRLTSVLHSCSYVSSIQ